MLPWYWVRQRVYGVRCTQGGVRGVHIPGCTYPRVYIPGIGLFSWVMDSSPGLWTLLLGPEGCLLGPEGGPEGGPEVVPRVVLRWSRGGSRGVAVGSRVSLLGPSCLACLSCRFEQK